MLSKTKMGKKGKNKNQTPNVHQTTLSPEYENIEKEEKIQETVAEIPKVEQIQKDTKAAEILTEDVLESKDATLKSKKKRNRKKKSKFIYLKKGLLITVRNVSSNHKSTNERYTIIFYVCLICTLFTINRIL